MPETFVASRPSVGRSAQEAVIAVRGLRKSYGDLEAVRGVDLDIRHGEIFTFLGPNGAGKTTTVEILEGYRQRDGGEVSVLGQDPAHAGRDWRARVGVVLQVCQVQAELTVRESLQLFASYYPAPRSVDETLELVGLRDAADRRAGRLSGGQQRRLDVALALVGDPELLFLDEPTTGFDPAARHQAWDVIANLRELGKTVLLTTHYMDEAQALADRVGIIRDGAIIAEGTVDDIGGRDRASTWVTFSLPPGAGLADLPREFGAHARMHQRRVELRTANPLRTLAALAEWAEARGLDLPDVEARRPSLEDIYLDLTARA